MATRKSSEITDVNALGMYDFHIQRADGYDDELLLIGDRGYPHYYRVELLFIDVEYIASALFFGDMGSFRFRMATEEEATIIYENSLEYPPQATYCFEEDPARRGNTTTRNARKYFVVASRVEITVHYDAENANHLLAVAHIQDA